MYERNLIEYIPENLREVKEYNAILTLGEQPEMVESWNAADNVMNDQFIMDATENGVSRWEKIMKIVPKATDTLEARKFALLAKSTEQLPYTFTALHGQMEMLCGEDGFSIERNVNTFTLKVRVALAAKSNFDAVKELLERVVPANMIVDISLLHNQNEVISAYTHEQLSAYTHEQLRNEVVNNG